MNKNRYLIHYFLSLVFSTMVFISSNVRAQSVDLAVQVNEYVGDVSVVINEYVGDRSVCITNADELDRETLKKLKLID